jgi:NaMN:DMB phosphoribosyltransferase
MNIWVSGFVVWVLLLILTFRYCSGWRSQMWAYGLMPIAALLWLAPSMALGSSRAKGAGEVIAYGFWAAAVYLGGLLIAEFVSGATKKADSQS